MIEIPTIDPATITTEQKLKAAKRELAMRRNVYPRRVDDGKMKPAEAAREIAAMAAIVADYERENRADLLMGG